MPSGTSLDGETSPSWKYRSAEPSSMAPRLPMPRITLKRRPSSRNDSPGLSSVPASIEPIITLSAPAASAFTTSPEYLMPPSAITGASPAPRTASRTAVIWGTPTPVTTRVVQIEPGPTPTFTASTPRSTSARAPASVATLPPTSCDSGNASRRHAIVLSTPSEWPCAESTTITSQPASTSSRVRASASGARRTAAATRSRPCSSWLALGAERAGVKDHPRLAPLHPVHLGGLAVHRHVLVDHADPALARHGDRHLRLGDGVHCSGDERNVQGELAGEAGAGVDAARMHARVPRHQQHVVEGEGDGRTKGSHG